MVYILFSFLYYSSSDESSTSPNLTDIDDTSMLRESMTDKIEDIQTDMAVNNTQSINSQRFSV